MENDAVKIDSTMTEAQRILYNNAIELHAMVAEMEAMKIDNIVKISANEEIKYTEADFGLLANRMRTLKIRRCKDVNVNKEEDLTNKENKK